MKDRQGAAQQADAVIRWRLRNGRCGKTARMSRAEAEVLVRELRQRFGRMSFEVG